MSWFLFAFNNYVSGGGNGVAFDAGWPCCLFFGYNKCKQPRCGAGTSVPSTRWSWLAPPAHGQAHQPAVPPETSLLTLIYQEVIQVSLKLSIATHT